MDIEQCKKYLINLNDTVYATSLTDSTLPQRIDKIIECQKFHNSLLEFTIKPRGMLTKQARNY
jgi:hypothetical protein